MNDEHPQGGNSARTRHPFVDDGRSTYIYKLSDPSGESFRMYVGMTVSPTNRLSHHIYSTSKKHTFNGRWLKSLLMRGVKPEMTILEVVPAGADYQATEQKWIAQLKSEGTCLTNLTDGGEGSRGYSPTLETRLRVAAAIRGQKRSAESCARMSKARLGHVVSIQTRSKISAAKMGVKLPPFTPEHRARISEAKVGRKCSPETIAKMSQANLGKVLSLETREKLSKAIKGMKRSDETRAKISAALKGKPKTSEHIAKLTGQKRSPETCARISAGCKNRHMQKKESQNAE